MEPTHFIELQNNIISWFMSTVWTLDTLTQGLFIFATFLIAGTLYKRIKIRLTEEIDELVTNYRTKLILHNVRKLSLPFIMLILLFPAKGLGIFLKPEMDFSLIDATTSLLLAWIVVRLAFQFVANSFVRNIFAFSIWGIAALSILGILDDTANTLDAIGMNLGDFRLSALTVIKGIFALFFLLYSAIFASSLLERRIKKISGLNVSSRVLLAKIVRITLVTLALLVGITSAGVDLSLLAVFSGAIGLGIGFGLQKGVSNLFSGMLLLLDKSITPGDIIELEGGTFGWVDQMGARYTSIVTRDNKSYLIPNEDFVTQQVVNWSHGNTLVRIEVEFGVDYRHNPHEIKEMAVEAAKTAERVCNDPPVVCHFVEFGDSSINFKLRFWIRDAEKGITNMRGAVMLALWDTFKEHKIQIPYPHREVYIHEVKETKKAS
jgi:small-conductance mechanosensitive channel